MIVSIREFVFVIAGSVILSTIALVALLPWARQPRRLAVIEVSTALGILIWNLALNITNATALNVDSRLLGLSVQDVGSGVSAFILTLLVLRFVSDRGKALSSVLTAAAICGLVTMVVDLLG